MHKVTCVYCKQVFDRDKEPATLVATRRYAHVACAEKANLEKSQNEKDYEQLILYIRKILKESYVDNKVKKQIMNYKKQYNYTYSGMLKTLQWWYEIEKNPIDKANGGIGIIPFVYQDAYNYFKAIYDAQQRAAAGLCNYVPRVEEIEIPPPVATYRLPQLFDIEEEVLNDN